MSESRVIILCNSAYQLLTAIQLRLTIYKQDHVDVLVSNQMSRSCEIADNLKQISLFNSVRHIDTNRRDYRNRFFETLHDLALIHRLHRESGDFDVFCTANISVFSILFVRFYQKRRLEVNIYEDGMVTYCRCFEHFDRAGIVARLLLPHGVLGQTKHIYIFNPELLEWHVKGVTPIAIPKIDSDNHETVKMLNQAFGYDNSAAEYDRPYLFMEESFYADGYPVPDVELVERIGSAVGKDNVMIKLHPRNGVDRFSRLGYKVSSNSAIPWELILLNQSMQDKTLLSISSSSLLQPYLLLGQEVRSIALLDLLSEKPGNMSGELGNFMLALFERLSPICITPHTEQELYELLREK